MTGRLIAVGGPDLAAAGRPDPGTARPLPGVVKLTAADGKVAAVDVGADGSFRIRAQVGSYRLSGRSPQYGNGRYRCDAVDRSGEYIDKVNVGATRVLSDVVCQMK